MNRRNSLQTAAVGFALGSLPLHTLAAPHKGRIRITDVKCMIVRGAWDWNLIQVKTGVIPGEDPLNVDKLHTKMLMMSDGAGALGENKYYRIREAPGFGVTPNPDVARSHLAPGEAWWG